MAGEMLTPCGECVYFNSYDGIPGLLGYCHILPPTLSGDYPAILRPGTGCGKGFRPLVNSREQRIQALAVDASKHLAEIITTIPPPNQKPVVILLQSEYVQHLNAIIEIAGKKVTP